MLLSNRNQVILIEQSIHKKIIHVMSLNLFHIIKNTKCKNKPKWKQFVDCHVLFIIVALSYTIRMKHFHRLAHFTTWYIWIWTYIHVNFTIFAICDLALRNQYKPIALIKVNIFTQFKYKIMLTSWHQMDFPGKYLCSLAGILSKF